jgi:hypothetical protein
MKTVKIKNASNLIKGVFLNGVLQELGSDNDYVLTKEGIDFNLDLRKGSKVSFDKRIVIKV